MTLAEQRLELGLMFDLFTQDMHDQRTGDRILAVRHASQLVIYLSSLNCLRCARLALPRADRLLTLA